jgi:AraC family transcriptional regulator
MRDEPAPSSSSLASSAGFAAVPDVPSFTRDVGESSWAEEATGKRVRCLVRQAMAYLESEPGLSRRCLKEASELLEGRANRPVTLNAAHRVAANVAFRPGGLASWQARRALTYIEDNLGSKLEVEALADVVSFSKSHFSRAFKRSLGLSPMAYVATRRVEHAKEMMTSTRELLTQIALASGFADQSHLNRSFRRMVGMSPGVWRRAHAPRVGEGQDGAGRLKSPNSTGHGGHSSSRFS